MLVRRLLPLCLALAACGDDPALNASVEAAGPYPPGTRALTLTDTARARTLPTQVWYPAVAEAAPAVAAGFSVTEYETGANRTRLTELLAAADPTCPTATAHAARDAAPAAGRFPLIAMSHCHECTRFSTATVAERLASHGFVVIAVDHVGNTLWDQPSGLPIDTTTLTLRVGDVRFAIDAALSGGDVPAELQAIVDSTRVGVVGHSFGAVTAGKVAQDDPRVGAALALAAPMQNPLLPGVSLAELTEPLGFLVAVEDNSITEIGNNFMRDNFAMAPGPAWKAEVADAGHWSVSDLAGLTPGFAAGCGAGTRQTDNSAFTYLPTTTGRGLTAAYTTAFFQAYLSDDAGARGYLDADRPAGIATTERR